MGCGGGSAESTSALDTRTREVRADFQARCDIGDTAACAALFPIFSVGDHPHLDSRRIEVFGRACERGDVIACDLLGHLMGHGHSVPPDPQAGAEHYARTCESGDGLGCYLLGSAHASGIGARHDDGRALALFERACHLNHSSGCLRAGVAYLRGKGAVVDTALAVARYRRACELGSASGCNQACWFGSLTGQVESVVDTCEAAVERASARSLANYRDSRGLNRALLGDYEGAIEDFEAFVADHPDEALRPYWIERLDEGESPFDEATLNALLNPGRAI